MVRGKQMNRSSPFSRKFQNPPRQRSLLVFLLLRPRLFRIQWGALHGIPKLDALSGKLKPVKITLGKVCVVSAGTSDLPVAEEAAVTAEVMGNEVDRVYDVGVAGLHRILGQLDRLQSANVVIVAAGMEGALPSVVAGLVAQPVIAVPTSIGYGASFQGVAALLGMLNSCGSGVTVVNIDNGFGAAYAASQINMMITKQSRDQKHIQHA